MMERTILRWMPGLFTLLAMLLVFPTDSMADNHPPYEGLYMIGDATPAGWNISNPTPMQADPQDAWIFTYTGHMFSGEFKLLTFTGGDWCDEEDWIRPPSMHPPLENTDYIITNGCAPEEEDFKWKIEDDQLSSYTITVDLREETITIVSNGVIDVPYETLFVAGNATSGGWDNPVAMERDAQLPWIFRFSGFLIFGEFNIKTFTGSSCDEDWIRPPSNHPPLSDTLYIVTKGCLAAAQDFRWRITNDEVGEYNITVDLQAETITIGQDGDDPDPVIEHMFLVGDATPGGWSLDEQTPMNKSETNPAIFSWDGNLTAGEFKIKTYIENNFCGGDWIHPLEQAQAFSATNYEFKLGCGPHDDYKWVVTEAQTGSFSITVNLDEETIIINGEALSIENISGLPVDYGLNQNYPNPFNPSTVIGYQLPVSSQVRLEVFDVTGRSVAVLVDGTLPSGRHEVRFEAGNLASGLYLYRLNAGTFVQTRKLMLIR